MSGIAEIRQWIGYLEHADERLLGVFTANAGKGGCTIFADMLRTDQGAELQGLPWCATFVHAALARPDVLGRAHPGVRVLARRMFLRGLWRGKTYVPQPLDLIFLTNRKDRRISHCGIVETANETEVISIEGNAVDPSGVFPIERGGAVARRVRARTDRKIVGYAATGTKLNEKERKT